MLGAALGRKKLLTILALLFEFYMFKGSREARRKAYVLSKMPPPRGLSPDFT